VPEEDPNDRQKQFLKALDTLSTSVRKQQEAIDNLVAITKKQIEITNAQIKVSSEQIEAAGMIFEAIMKPNDGAIPAIDDLIQEIQELRQDMRSISKGTSVAAMLGPLLKRGR
jgi:citrate lyase beta subunit